MDLGDLNIVAIAPPQPSKGKNNLPYGGKKRKINKYERRRQKAAKAKIQQTKKDIHEAEVRNGKKIWKKDLEEESSLPVEAKEEPSSTEKTNVEGDIETVEAKDLENEPSASANTSGAISHNEKTESNTSPPAKIIKGQKQKVDTVPSSLVAPEVLTDTKTDNATLVSSTSMPEKASRRRRPVTEEPNEEEHADYMAKFHARPMELDRRSGARSKKTVSKASTHIFGQDQKDWTSLGLHSRLLQTLNTKFKLPQPTSVQSRTIQTIRDPSLQKRNVLIHSETGSGKTLAYLLPILQQLGFTEDGEPLKVSRKELGTKCIILCPTRELASQTLSVVEKLCQANFAGWMVPGGLLGGDSRSSEKARIRKGLGIIVGTPGRLLDHLNKTESLLLNLKGKLRWLVLDEADHLLDMGLGDQVKQIVQSIRANEASKAQPWWRSVLVSATVTPSVEALAKERMLCGDQPWVWVKGAKDQNGQNRESEEAKDMDDSLSEKNKTEDGFSQSTPRQLAQFHITVTAKLRLSTLVSFLVQRVSKGERTVVFMGTCASVDFHHKLLQSMESLWVDDDDEENKTNSKNGLFGDKAQVFKLHGNVQHSKRNQTLKLFDKANQGAILLTTDVSARGLNLEGVDWTVQYDPPCEIADYVHRVGRVARAGKAGHSLLFLLPSEKGYLDVLQTKGIVNLEPLPLSATLNKAASLCSDWTNAGLKFGGNKEMSNQSRVGDIPRGSRLGEYFSGEVQRRMEDCIVEENAAALKKWREQKKVNKKQNKKAPVMGKEGELMELARDAFVSFLRMYATKREAAVRSIFSARALHVGHVARSFALKDPPKSLVSKHKHNKKVASEMEAKDQQANLPKALQFDGNDYTERDDEGLDNFVDETKPDLSFLDNNDRPFKRPKLRHTDSSRHKNAKSIMLHNAMKMQSNLMDAM